MSDAAECKCIELLDAEQKMVASNTRIMTGFIGPDRAFIATIKRFDDKRGKPIMVMASFCPFCGVRYPKYVSPFREVVDA